MAVMQLDVVSTEKRLLSVEASEVYARSLDGEIGILPGHQPCLLALDVAPVTVRDADGGEQGIAVHNGFLFFRDNRCVILADTAELPGDIDAERAESRKRELESQLGDEDDERTLTAIKRQDVRIELSRG